MTVIYINDWWQLTTDWYMYTDKIISVLTGEFKRSTMFVLSKYWYFAVVDTDKIVIFVWELFYSVCQIQSLKFQIHLYSQTIDNNYILENSG